MRVCLSAATFLIMASAGSAFAQSMPAVNWAGPYIGAHAGLDMANHHIDTFNESIEQFSNAFIPGRGIVVVPGTTSPFPGSDFGDTNFVGGGQAGYAFAFDNWVLGAEGDLDFGGQSSTVTVASSLPPTAIQSASTLTLTRKASSSMNWSIRARAGYAWDDFLLYATAGVVGSHFKVSGFDTFTNPGGLAALCSPNCQSSTNAVTNTTAGTLSDDPVGWTIGGGGEVALGGGFSLGLEFRHNDYGSETFNLPTNNVSVTVPTVTSPAGGSSTGAIPPRAVLGATPINFMDDIVSVRLNFHL